VVIGSVGISGDTSDRDEYCAILAIKSVNLIPEPKDVDQNWNS